MFKDIPNFPEYCISEDGVVVSKRNGKLKEIAQSIESGGYPIVSIRSGTNNFIRKYVHQLLLITFIGPKPFHKAVCRHLDGNPSNNKLSNLAWGTQVENVADAFSHGTRGYGEKSTNVKLTQNDVLEIVKLLKSGITQKTIADRYNVSQGNVSLIHQKKNLETHKLLKLNY